LKSGKRRPVSFGTCMRCSEEYVEEEQATPLNCVHLKRKTPLFF
jgi:hypothetical protein